MACPSLPEHYLSGMRAVPTLLAGMLVSVQVHAQHPVVSALLDSVRIDSMVSYAEQLSGEVPVDVGNGDELILSRHKLNAGNAVASQWLQQRLGAIGYQPEVQSWSTTGENVLVTIPGTVHPGRRVVLCAHYDAMPGGFVNAPAADDDGSGTAALLEAARVIAGTAFEHTLVLAFWDEEEQGLVGSAYYAAQAAANDDTVLAVVNMDALAWDGDGDGLARIHTRPIANSQAIKDSALMVNTTYGINMPLAVNDPGATYSDHASFWNEGYGAILVIEDFDNDGNPYYHTPDDRVQYFDQPYFHQLARLAIGTALVWAVPTGSNTSVGDLQAAAAGLDLYPNPANEQVRVWADLAVPAPVELDVLDLGGRVVRSLRSFTLPAGRTAVDIPVGDLAPGGYLVRLRAGTVVRARRLMIAR